MPYRIYPVNLTPGDSVANDQVVTVAYENGSPGDDVTLAVTCRNIPAGHGGPHSASDMRSDSGSQCDLPLTHTGNSSSGPVTIRGSISSMDPFVEQDVFEVPDITVAADPGEGSPAVLTFDPLVRGRGGARVLGVRIGEDAPVRIGFPALPAAGRLFVVVQAVRRHGAVRIIHILGPIEIPCGRAGTAEVHLGEGTWRQVRAQAEAQGSDRPGPFTLRGLLESGGTILAGTVPFDWPPSLR